MNKQLIQRQMSSGCRIWSTKLSMLSRGQEKDEEIYGLKDRSRHLAIIRKELRYCLDSFNPFDRVKIASLREEVRVAENEEKEKKRVA